MEDAQESACLVAFSCQTRDILEDRPAIKNRKNAQTCLDVPLVTDYSSLAYYHPFFQGCGDVKKHVCACSQLLPLANLVEIQAGVSQTRDNCTGFKLDSGKALKICESQGMWDPRSFRAFRFVSNPFSLLLFHQD